MANKNNIKLWIDALRSNEYNQGKGCLCNITDNGAKFCCLGVVCEVYDQNNEDKLIKRSVNVFDSTRISYDGCVGELPDKVKKWLEIEESSYYPSVNVPKSSIYKNPDNIDSGKVYLTRLNDVYELKFDEIADFIESTYLKD